MAAVHAGARPVSGGTDLILHPPDRPTDLVDLTRLPLAGVTSYAGGVRVGANTTLTEMLQHPAVGALANGVVAALKHRPGHEPHRVWERLYVALEGGSR